MVAQRSRTVGHRNGKAQLKNRIAASKNRTTVLIFHITFKRNRIAERKNLITASSSLTTEINTRQAAQKNGLPDHKNRKAASDTRNTAPKNPLPEHKNRKAGHNVWKPKQSQRSGDFRETPKTGGGNLVVRREATAPRRLRAYDDGPNVRRRCRAVACHRTTRPQFACDSLGDQNSSLVSVVVE